MNVTPLPFQHFIIHVSHFIKTHFFFVYLNMTLKIQRNRFWRLQLPIALSFQKLDEKVYLKTVLAKKDSFCPCF